MVLNSDLRLHIETRKVLLSLMLFVIITVVLSLLFVASTSKYWIQLSSLFQSKYEYSAMIEKAVGLDDYYLYQSGVVFTVTPDAVYRIDAEILMQPEKSEYSNMIAWNAKHLSLRGVAISKNIAIANKLAVGDMLYSKHRATDILTEYTIEQIVPEVINARSGSTKTFEGIIIMGYDKDYVSNIAHETVTYTSKAIVELMEYDGVHPHRINYRDEEIGLTIKSLILPIGTAIILMICLSFILTFHISHLLKRNFKRLLILGYPKRNLENAWNRTFLFICAGTIFGSFLANFAGTLILTNNVAVVLPCFVFLLQIAVCVVMCQLSRVCIERG